MYWSFQWLGFSKELPYSHSFETFCLSRRLGKMCPLGLERRLAKRHSQCLLKLVSYTYQLAKECQDPKYRMVVVLVGTEYIEGRAYGLSDSICPLYRKRYSGLGLIKLPLTGSRMIREAYIESIYCNADPLTLISIIHVCSIVLCCFLSSSGYNGIRLPVEIDLHLVGKLMLSGGMTPIKFALGRW